MLNTFAPAVAEVNSLATDFYAEPCILATEAASFAAWQAEEDADADQWSDDYADEMAGLALAESRLDMGLMAW